MLDVIRLCVLGGQLKLVLGLVKHVSRYENHEATTTAI